MRIAYISAGAAGMYCGSCLHDNTLAAALLELGHDVALTPTYTPLRTDEERVSIDRVFFGAVNVYLQQKSAFFRYTPWFVDRLLDRPRLLNWLSRFGAATDAAALGALTLSMLEGEQGRQRKELEKLVDWLAASLRPEIVHLSFSLFLGFARRIKERLGVPIVCSLQGEDLYLERLPEPYRGRAVAAIAARAADVDLFTAPCAYYAERMAEYGLPAERIERVPLGIRTEDFQAPEEEERRGTLTTLGYLARLCPEKGLHQLIDAFLILTRQLGPDRLRLRIAGYLGEGDRRFVAEQRQRLAAARVAERVEWVGEVDRRGKVDFLRSLDLFALPTVYREPKGLSVLEALAAGVPAVLPRHGAFPELLEATGGGVLVEPGAPHALAAGIRKLVEDPHLRLRLGEAGRLAVRRSYSTAAMAEANLAVYRRLLDGAAGGRSDG